MVDAPRRIIALDEDAFLDGPQFLWDDESEWEDIDDFDLGGAGPSRDGDADYLLAKRLQDEEDAKYVPARRGERRGYADVLRDKAVAMEGSFPTFFISIAL